MARIITVFGATGTQGSSVVNAILADGTFTPRAVTRNRASDGATELLDKRVEVVQADLWDVESLKKAIAGSEGVFGVTNTFDPSIIASNPAGEIEQGRNLAIACKAVGVKFFVFSSLPDVTKFLTGNITSYTTTVDKAAIDDFLKIEALPHAILHAGWFGDNLWKFGALSENPDSGALEIRIPLYSPDSTQAVTWVARDIGPSAVALFKNYQDHPEIWGQTFYAVTAQITYPELAKTIGKALGKPVTFVSTPTTGMAEFDDMYACQSEFGTYKDATIPDPRLIALGVKFGTLEEFAEKEVKPRFA